jgi:hypothetical protein
MRTAWVFTAVVVLGGMPGCKPAGGARCSDIWEAVRGTQESDAEACSAFIGTSAEVKPAYDWWGALFDAKKLPAGTSLKIEVTFSRPLEDSDRDVSIHFRGGYFGVAQDKYYFWEGDDRNMDPAVPHWTGWQQTRANIHQETTIAVRQKGADLEGFINGALVGTFKLNGAPAPGPIGVGFKSAKGKVAKVKMRGFSIAELSQ